MDGILIIKKLKELINNYGCETCINRDDCNKLLNNKKPIICDIIVDKISEAENKCKEMLENE